MRKSLGALLWLLLLFPAGAASIDIYYGCYVCEAEGYGGDSYCKPVGHEQAGDGTRCEEDPLGPWCSMKPDPCYNVDVNGGGGGSGGGGGACTTTGFCPAECFSCSSGGRPRI